MRARGLFFAVLAALSGCGAPLSSPPDAGSTAPTAPVEQPHHDDDAPAAVAPVTIRAGDVVEIPAGSLKVGSLPGTADRRPSVEADLTEVALGTVRIDRLPYPNDPARPPTLVSSRREAEALCASEGRRLCHELEWERACKGETANVFATGDAIDLAACAADATACASPAGVLDLGVRAPEWTASDADPRLARLERTVVARGAGVDDPLALHRCASRQAVAPSEGQALAFRCCEGEAPSLEYPDVGVRRLFRDLTLDEREARELLASVPELAPYAQGFHPYDREDALSALARGGATEADMQWEIAPGPFAWSPSTGEEVWILAGRSGERALIAALYPLPGGGFRHAASFVFDDEAAPVVILRTRASRGELLWSTCWGCAGESGAIRFDEHAQIVIAQQ